MQIRIFSIPIPGGEKLNDEMNQFLRSKRVLQVGNQLVTNENGTFWCFCIKYLEDAVKSKRQKVDYRSVLDKESFNRFSKMREIRKKLAQEDGIPAYAVFTDEELAELAAKVRLDKRSMLEIRGIGQKKIEKYGPHFFTGRIDEKDK